MPSGETTRRPSNKTRQAAKRSSNRESKADQRRTGAAARQRTAELRKKVKSTERGLENAEQRIAELEAELGDPAVYDEPERVRALADTLDSARSDAARIMAEWEAASVELEAMD